LDESSNLSSSTKPTPLHHEVVFFIFLPVRKLVFRNKGKKIKKRSSSGVGLKPPQSEISAAHLSSSTGGASLEKIYPGRQRHLFWLRLHKSRNTVRRRLLLYY